MTKIFNILIMAIMLAMIMPAIAQLPSAAVQSNLEDVPTINRSIINPFDPGYVWNNPYAVRLSGINPTVFDNIAFAKNPGGLASATYTQSINEFLSYDPDAGKSNITVNAAKVGLTAKTAYVGSSVSQSKAAAQVSPATQTVPTAQNDTV